MEVDSSLFFEKTTIPFAFDLLKSSSHVYPYACPEGTIYIHRLLFIGFLKNARKFVSCAIFSQFMKACHNLDVYMYVDLDAYTSLKLYLTILSCKCLF